MAACCVTEEKKASENRWRGKEAEGGETRSISHVG